MGYNTTVLVMNDSLSAIEEDPEFGKNLARTIYRMYDDRNSRDVPARNHCNAATVIESHHADGIAIVAVGQNYGSKIDECYYVGRHDQYEGQFNILKQMADNLGYRLVKKAPKKEIK